jgi:hypothetical protein
MVPPSRPFIIRITLHCFNSGHKATEDDNENQPMALDDVPVAQPKRDRTPCSNVCTKIFGAFITLYNGWKCYMGQNVRFAGLALSCLYMTVLGFDNITTGRLNIFGRENCRVSSGESAVARCDPTHVPLQATARWQSRSIAQRGSVTL